MNKLPISFEYHGIFVVRHPLYEAGMNHWLYGVGKKPYFMYTAEKWYTVPHERKLVAYEVVPLDDYIEFPSLEALIEYETANSEVQFRVVYHE